MGLLFRRCNVSVSGGGVDVQRLSAGRPLKLLLSVITAGISRASRMRTGPAHNTSKHRVAEHREVRIMNQLAKMRARRTVPSAPTCVFQERVEPISPPLSSRSRYTTLSSKSLCSLQRETFSTNDEGLCSSLQSPSLIRATGSTYQRGFHRIAAGNGDSSPRGLQSLSTMFWSASRLANRLSRCVSSGGCWMLTSPPAVGDGPPHGLGLRFFCTPSLRLDRRRMWLCYCALLAHCRAVIATQQPRRARKNLSTQPKWLCFRVIMRGLRHG